MLEVYRTGGVVWWDGYFLRVFYFEVVFLEVGCLVVDGRLGIWWVRFLRGCLSRGVLAKGSVVS